MFQELATSKAATQETIGARIARLRRDVGLTQTEFAQALGVSQPVVSDYENDVIKVSAETVIQLALNFGANADEILGLAKPARTSIAIKNRRIYRQLQSIDKLPKTEALAPKHDALAVNYARAVQGSDRVRRGRRRGAGNANHLARGSGAGARL